MGRMEGKVCLITGGARGMGAAEARLFRDEGAIVWISDVLEDEGKAMADELGITYRHHDVRDEQKWESVIAEIIERAGRIDGLVNNAGIFRENPLVKTSRDEFEHVMEINCTGTFLGMRTVAPRMVEAGSGSIVNISSFAGMKGMRNAFAYSTSKWAVRGMTKHAALELAGKGVRVNSIHPGIIDTAMTEQLGDDALAAFTRGTPMKRAAAPEEVARMALFLASDESSFSTGSEFLIDGGGVAG